MKVLIYFEDEEKIKTSGIGRAMRHQMKACSLAGIDYTIDPKDSFDIAHINTLWAKSHALLKRCHKNGIPVIVHGHSTYEDFRRSFKCWQLAEPFFDARIRLMYSSADLIITPTPYSKKLIEGYGFNKKVLAISNGIDLAEYAPDPQASAAYRARFSLEEGEKTVIGVGFPFERKGIQDFFEVARHFPEIKFIWFGALSKWLTNDKVKRWVHQRPANAIMAGYCKGEVMRGAYQSASCLFFPSYEETEGIVVLEALASKTPLLVRDIGVYEPWLQDGVNCHKGKNNEDFEKELALLLKQGEAPEVLANGYEVAQKRSLDKVGASLKEAYEGLLSSFPK